jgi:hypothetical protein
LCLVYLFPECIWLERTKAWQDVLSIAEIEQWASEEVTQETIAASTVESAQYLLNFE